MKTRVRWFGQLVLCMMLVTGMLFPTGGAATASHTVTVNGSTLAGMNNYGSVIVDGLWDVAYNDPIASDSVGDHIDYSWVDLGNLWVAQDSTFFYFLFSVNANLTSYNIGDFALYIDTTNDTQGATSDAMGHKVTVAGTHKPEYGIYTWVDSGTFGTDHTRLYGWNQTGGVWGSPVPIDGAALQYIGGATSQIELKVARARLGNPDRMWLEVWSSTGSVDNARDTINYPANDWNATDITTTATLSNSTPYGAPVIDGNIDRVYGPAVATDSTADSRNATNLNLGSLYITEDDTNLYFAFTVLDDFSLDNTGKYAIYIDTTEGDGKGATKDALGRNVQVTSYNKPEYALYSAVDSPPYDVKHTEFYSWDGGWTQSGYLDDAALYTSKLFLTSTLEWKISKFRIGNPKSIYVEVWSTSSKDGSNAQDTINTPPEDWNATDSTTTAKLQNSTPYKIQYIPPPQAAHDNTIWWGALAFDSRNPRFRDPVGPVTTGTPVTLRLRSAAGDLTSASVRLYNDLTNMQTMLRMRPLPASGGYEYWEATVPAAQLPTIYWYRFIVTDGTATGYYEDTADRLGGLGKAYTRSLDYSYQLTIYDPTFQTPDWVKKAVIYQVFPDRFRDGDPANNKADGSFYYNQKGGTITRSLAKDWNTPVCDPRADGACNGAYGNNFYGGDLKGLTDKLDYLKNLGITAIYLNPIFDSPSNHRYDTSDYLKIAPSLGTLADFTALAQAADKLGIHLILDGVFNHTSSDSIYFDRYHLYRGDGACESLTSINRSWYFFQPALRFGAGLCYNNATYTTWSGYDTMPKLNTANTAVRNFIYGTKDTSVAQYWLNQGASGWRLDVGGSVDPGLTGDPANTFWEGFRAAVRATNKDAYIVGEEWGNASPWLLGKEWDATMNYQYASAILGFFRDTPYTDNDHNSNSAAGPLNPLTPSQLDARLKNWMERYPPEAMNAMMNVLDSHDTSRVLYMLDEGKGRTDPTLYLDPKYDWSDAINRLKGAALLQMTLPGAPTIYYGDEVGLVAPDVKDTAGNLQDDPYNRQPYPWLDESGTPFYMHLQTETSQKDLLTFYQKLIAARNSHPALQTGTFKTLLVDDRRGIYAFVRRTATDAVLVVINQNTTPQDITIPVDGLLSLGTTLRDVVTPSTIYTVSRPPRGPIQNLGGPIGTEIGINGVPGRGGALAVYETGSLTPPPAPTGLAATAGSGQVDLSWNGVVGASDYNVYRANFSGGDLTFLDTAITTTFSDTTPANGQTYYYVVTAVDAASLLESEHSNEASATPHLIIDSASSLTPTTINHTIGAAETEPITAQVSIAGVTTIPGATPTLMAQIGFGPDYVNRADWQWFDAAYDQDVSNNDQFKAVLLPEKTGTFFYSYRFSTTGGSTWTDMDGSAYGTLTVNPNPEDSAAPSIPTGLRLVDFGADFLDLAWNAATDNKGVYAYDVYRSATQGSGYTFAGRVLDPALTFHDSDLTSGATYYYVVKAVDPSFNFSAYSAELPATPNQKMVHVHLNTTVPAYTTGTVYFSRLYDVSAGTLGDWDAAGVAMTKASDTLWTLDLTLLDGTVATYKFTRGGWETVMKGADGNEELANLTFTATYGANGQQEINDTVLNWRDPLVVSYTPADGAVGVPQKSPITVTWSQAVASPFAVTVKNGAGDTVSGTTSFIAATNTVSWIPDIAMLNGMYSVEVSGQADTSPEGDTLLMPVTWSFTTAKSTYFLPMIAR